MNAREAEPEPEVTHGWNHAAACTESDLLLIRIALRCFEFKLQPDQFEWVHESRLLTMLGQVERCNKSNESVEKPVLSGVHIQHAANLEPAAYVLSVSSNDRMKPSLSDKKTDTFWECDGNDRTPSVTVEFKEPTTLDGSLLRLHIDNTRDAGEKQVSKVEFEFEFVDGKPKQKSKDISLDMMFAGWIQCSTSELGPEPVLKVVFKFSPKSGGHQGVRVRGLRILHLHHAESVELESVQQQQAERESMDVFRTLASCVLFGATAEAEDGAITIDDEEAEDGALRHTLSRHGSSDLRQRVVGMLFQGERQGGTSQALPPMQAKVRSLLPPFSLQLKELACMFAKLSLVDNRDSSSMPLATGSHLRVRIASVGVQLALS